MYTEQNFWLVSSVLFNHNYFKNNTPIFSMVNKLMRPKNHMGLVATKPVFGGLQTTKVQTSLYMRAVWSVPLLFALRKVPYVNFLQVKFQFSS